MRFSLGYLPDYSLVDAIKTAKLADDLGFYGMWAADEIYHRDPWITMAACAINTKKLIFGPAVTHVYLREPTLIAQALGTLDELSNGRAACALSIGNIIMLDQYHIDWRSTKPLRRLREAVGIIRTMLEKGTLTHKGDYFNYTGLFTSAKRPNRIPIYIGGSGGPLSFRMAGELGDGAMFSTGYSHRYYEDAVKQVKIGARRAGRDLTKIDVAGWVNFCIAEKSEVARKAARCMVGFYIPSMPERQLRMHDITPEEVREINTNFLQGNIKKVIDLTTEEMVEKASISGSPAEIVDKIRKDLESTGVKHLVCSIIDRQLVKLISGRDFPDLPDYDEALRMINNEIMPHLKS